MRKLLIFTVAFMVVSLNSIMIFAETGQRFNENGYSLHISATELSGKIVVTGSIKGGDSSEYLYVSCSLVDENGRQDSVQASIKNYRHSQRFSVKKDMISNGGRRWIVSDVQIYKR